MESWERKEMTFSELGLKKPLLDSLEVLNFETPTPIQEQAIPALLGGENDFIGLAQTGTGKTGAYGLPMLHLLDPKDRRTQGLIICPTRELCIQVTKDLQKFASKMRAIQTTAVYGGAGIVGQIHELKRGSQVVVATPGRLCDLIRRRAVNLSSVTCTVLDEADEMLNMGFKEDIDAILDTVAKHAKTWLFSATMPSEVAAIASKYQTNPVEVTIGSKNEGAENITHQVYMMQERDRYQALRRILDATPEIFGLVFCRTRIDTQEVADRLITDGYQAEPLHGDLSQAQRDCVMSKFRRKRTRILVATDVAARGLDVDDITHVINFSLPEDALIYTHRSGRTARAGKSGNSIILINPREKYRAKQIERRLRIPFKLCKIPSGETICRNQLLAFSKKLAEPHTGGLEATQYLPRIYAAFEGMSKEELIDLIISKHFSHLLESYRNAPDINASTEMSRPRESYGQARRGTNGRPNHGRVSQGRGNQDRGNQGRPRQRGYEPSERSFEDSASFFISIGKLDNATKGAIVRLVCDKAGIKSQMIGTINVKREFSFFNVDKQAAERVRNNMKRVMFDGKSVKVRPSKPMNQYQNQYRPSH
jgi:ATP-dependent RNA helicase DeaD